MYYLALRETLFVFFFFTNFPVGLMEVQSNYIKIYKNMEPFNVPSGACPIKTLLLSQTT